MGEGTNQSPIAIRRIAGKKTSEYMAYDNMLTRVNNSSVSERYHKYEEYGIKVCERWLGRKGFDNFIYDLGLKPFPKAMLDRIDPYGDYCPENCRWVDRRTSNYNTAISTANRSGRVGVYQETRTGKWCAAARQNGPKVRLYRGDSFEEAVAARVAFEISEWGEEKKCSTPLESGVIDE